MGCCGKHRTPLSADKKLSAQAGARILPTDQCVLCAEKHISTAYALACEAGYSVPNRQRIVGELTCAALHLFKDHPTLAGLIRDARHAIQNRKEGDVDWHPLLTAVDYIAAREVQAQEQIKE